MFGMKMRFLKSIRTPFLFKQIFYTYMFGLCVKNITLASPSLSIPVPNSSGAEYFLGTYQQFFRACKGNMGGATDLCGKVHKLRNRTFNGIVGAHDGIQFRDRDQLRATRNSAYDQLFFDFTYDFFFNLVSQLFKKQEHRIKI